MLQDLAQVTIIYYHDESLELLHELKSFPKNKSGRIVIPEEFRKGKSIVAVCKGEIKIINKVGDRILPIGEVA